MAFGQCLGQEGIVMECSIGRFLAPQHSTSRPMGPACESCWAARPEMLADCQGREGLGYFSDVQPQKDNDVSLTCRCVMRTSLCRHIQNTEGVLLLSAELRDLFLFYPSKCLSMVFGPEPVCLPPGASLLAEARGVCDLIMPSHRLCPCACGPAPNLEAQHDFSM